MCILLKTERLTLRRFTKSDADFIYQLDNDPEVTRFINGGIPTPWRAIQNDILPILIHYDASNPVFGFWAAVENASGELMGWFSLRPSASVPGDVSLGYRLRKTAWGRGIATEGVCALIKKGFHQPGVHRVVATTYEENLASRRVMEKAGMRLVRRFRLTAEDLLGSDTFHTENVDLWPGDDLEYALEKAEWEEQQ